MTPRDVAARLRRCGLAAAWAVGFALVSFAVHAQADTYLAPDAFIASAFDGKPPEPQLVWPSPALQKRIRAVLGHPYKQLRVRYWRQADRTAWVLEDVGKEEEITIGFVLSSDAIERTDVLVFRETRGWEIRFPAFTRRFKGAKLAPGDELDKHVDGITGATLSVGAYQRLAKMALMLHQEVVPRAR